MILLTINTAPVDPLVGSVKLNLELNGRRTLDFGLITQSAAGVYGIPQIGNTIALSDPALGVTYFTGTIDSYTVENPQGLASLWYDIRCVDFNARADQLTVTGSWTNVNAGNIMAGIVDAKMIYYGEGATHNNVASGPVLPSFSVNAASITDTFNQICAACVKVQTSPVSDLHGSGFSWYFDFAKDLHFFSADDGVSVSAFSINATTPVWRTIKVTKDRSNYANLIIVRSAQILDSVLTTDIFNIGDSSPASLSFTTSAPVGSVPVITLTGVAKTVGIDSVDTGKDYYYNPGQTTIREDAAGPILSGTDSLVVSYYAILSNNFVMVQDQVEQARMSGIEGGSGVHEMVVDNSNAGTVTDATALAGSLLLQYARIPVHCQIEMDTNINIPEPGQIVNVNLPLYGLGTNASPVTDALMLIQRASAQLIAATGTHPIVGSVQSTFLRWTVEAVSTAYQPGWEKALFGNLGNAANSSSSATTASGPGSPTYPW